MTENDIYAIALPEVMPQPNTDAMVDLLWRVINTVVSSMPFKFTNGDLMGALMYLVVERGTESVSTEKLKEDIAQAIDRIAAQLEFERSGKKAN